MGYTTDFDGKFTFNKPVDSELKAYINAFSNTRHMKRDVNAIKTQFPDWQTLCFDGNLGEDGEYFVSGNGFDKDSSIIDYNQPPKNCPELWCQWIIRHDKLMWDGGEKFYSYIEWLAYLITNFFAPKGYLLNGDVEWQGEEISDHGFIHVYDNEISIERI